MQNDQEKCLSTEEEFDIDRSTQLQEIEKKRREILTNLNYMGKWRKLFDQSIENNQVKLLNSLEEVKEAGNLSELIYYFTNNFL